jgi:hypothetical protein
VPFFHLHPLSKHRMWIEIVIGILEAILKIDFDVLQACMSRFSQCHRIVRITSSSWPQAHSLQYWMGETRHENHGASFLGRTCHVLSMDLWIEMSAHPERGLPAQQPATALSFSQVETTPILGLCSCVGRQWHLPTEVSLWLQMLFWNLSPK